MRSAVLAVIGSLAALAACSEFPSSQKDEIRQDREAQSTRIVRHPKPRVPKRKGGEGACDANKRGSVSPLGILEQCVRDRNWGVFLAELERAHPENVSGAVLQEILRSAPWPLVPAMLHAITKVHVQLKDIGADALFGPLASVLAHCEPAHADLDLLQLASERAAHWAATHQATDLHPGLASYARDPQRRFVSILGAECPLYREVSSSFETHMHRHEVPAPIGACFVCLEDFSSPTAYALPCSHALCPTCAPVALRCRPKCPACSALATDALEPLADIYAPGYVPLDAAIENDLTAEQMAGAHARVEESPAQAVAQAQAVLAGLHVPHNGLEFAHADDESDDGYEQDSVASSDDEQYQLELQQVLLQSMHK